MNTLSKGSVTWREVDESAHDQRIDNFLHKILKGVPKSHIYRIVRGGEVRVNGRRVKVAYRLQSGDKVRLPPVRTARPASEPATRTVKTAFAGRVLLEDEELLVVDKPAGVAVHGGSGISSGVIEQLRKARSGIRFLELVHRLDRDTSGVLMLAKKRSALIALHAQLRDGVVKKHYLVLVLGEWKDAKRNVKLALHKYVSASGERRVVVDEDGAQAHTVFRLLRKFAGFSLLDAELKTLPSDPRASGALGFPIAATTSMRFRRQQAAAKRLNACSHAAASNFVIPAAAGAGLSHPTDSFLRSLKAGATNLMPGRFDCWSSTGTVRWWIPPDISSLRCRLLSGTSTFRCRARKRRAT
jgi:23S rRNA pseudouridine955/2504/2580 synthase